MYSFFENVFYIMVFITLYYEVVYFTRPAIIVEWKVYLKELTYNSSEPKLTSKVLTFLSLLAGCTTFIGLSTSQWFFFLTYLIISVLSYLLGNVFKTYKLSLIGISIDGFLCTCILLMIILNKYHFHYTATDIFNYLTKL